MCITQCLLALAAMSVGLAHSWDIAVSTINEIDFISNHTKTIMQFQKPTALAYDAVHNMLLLVERREEYASILGINLETKEQYLFGKRYNESIEGIAFDPVTSKLFWTDTDKRSIYWTYLKPGTTNNIHGNLLIKMDEEIPHSIAVDSCRGYVYWTNINIRKPTIERARLDGTKREVLIDSGLYMVFGLAIDQQTKRIYWADDREGFHYSIESADLDGKNREVLQHDVDHDHPNALSISKDSIYWSTCGTIWQIPKIVTKRNGTEFKEIITFKNEVSFDIAANYQIIDQIEGIPECKNLASLSQNKSETSYSFNASTKTEAQFCVNGDKINGKSVCKCDPGYTGERCDVSVCQNFCLNGDCTPSKNGEPKCSCKDGYSGERCETNSCHNYCLNEGHCFLNDQKPVCRCFGDTEGTRCEKLKVIVTTTKIPAPAPNPVPLPSPIHNESCICNNTPKEYKSANNEEKTITSPVTSESVDEEESCSGLDPIRDPIIMALAVICGLMSLACAVLITKVMQLRRRPRIKKRIIVNKNVTPMTARPDQCEITIENCCNMNICETPCFEPRSNIRPTLLDAKPGKEEKKNLIANMEYPDDPY